VLGSGEGCGKERNGAPAASNRRPRGEGQEKETGGGVRLCSRPCREMEEGSGSVRGWVGDVGRHGMDAAAPGCFDSDGHRL
jgi:hypothetical protein